MKTTTVRELRNNYSKVLAWVAKGDEVEITRRGKVVAKVVPAGKQPAKVDWTRSAAFNRGPWSRTLPAEEIAAIIAENRGDY